MDGKTDFFEIKAAVLQQDTIAPNIFAIVLDYCNQMSQRWERG